MMNEEQRRRNSYVMGKRRRNWRANVWARNGMTMNAIFTCFEPKVPVVMENDVFHTYFTITMFRRRNYWKTNDYRKWARILA